MREMSAAFELFFTWLTLTAWKATLALKGKASSASRPSSNSSMCARMNLPQLSWSLTFLLQVQAPSASPSSSSWQWEVQQQTSDHEEVGLVEKALRVVEVFRDGKTIHEVHVAGQNLMRTVYHLHLRFGFSISHTCCEGCREIFGPGIHSFVCNMVQMFVK